jgi:signal peptidase I
VSSLSIPTVILGVSALLVASRIIVKRTSQIPAAIRSSIIETLDACIFAAVLSLVIITFVVQAFYIPSGSMEPTLMVNDRILVAKFLYRFEPVRRGDVIVFRYPLNPQRDFVKRVIGLPHDRVQLREGVVYVNGHRLDERDYTIKPDFGNYGPVTVPPGQYFVLGDNRNNSEDSRFFGFVPRANIIGKAVFIYWPPQRVGFVH